jgi:gliding motility-associated-like protein
MRPAPLSFFVFIITVTCCVKGLAQTCSGSLGDPVIYQTFGSGPNPGMALPFGVTNMTYTSSDCPNDGYYTIANSINLGQNCHTTWQEVTSDHTGDPEGYMMVINASQEPSIFFTQTANGLCPNTTYEFSAYILNLITLAASGPNVNEPNITFSVETMSGQVLATYNTGTIPSTAGPTWNKYGTYFVTPAGVTDVVVKMTNNAPGGNGNDLILDDIAFRACGPIIRTGFGSLAATGDQNLCEGSSAGYTLTASVGQGYVNPLMQWQINYNNGGWTDLPGKTTPTLDIAFTNAVKGSYQYRLAVGEGDNINTVSCKVSSLPLTINVNPLPVVAVPPVTTVCQGDPLTITASGGASYTWQGPGLAPTNQNPLVISSVTPANAGTYIVTATSDKGCTGQPISTSVRVVGKVVATVASDQLSICTGGSAQLSASGGLYYQWTPPDGLNHDNIANPVASPLQTTTYTVKVSNDGCYDDSKSVTVKVDKSPTADAGATKYLFEGQSATLDGKVTGDDITSVYWTPATGLNDPTSLTPTASPTDPITYTLHAVSLSCGTATSSVLVQVYKNITIPNAFTPNNDGINDTWNIEALITYPKSVITIFTRDGQKVFESTGYPRPWDGTYNGSPLPGGTYYYVIDLKIDTPKISGWVLLIR